MRQILLIFLLCLSVRAAAQRVHSEIYTMLGAAIPHIAATDTKGGWAGSDPAVMPGIDVDCRLIKNALSISAGFRGSLYGFSYHSKTFRSHTAQFVSSVGFPIKLIYTIPLAGNTAIRTWAGVQPYVGIQYPDSKVHASAELGGNFKFNNFMSAGLVWIKPMHNYLIDHSSISFYFVMFELKFILPNPHRPLGRHVDNY